MERNDSDSHAVAEKIAADYSDCTKLNEADTRHQIIDQILHGVLSWPRASVACESYVAPGFADYVLLGRKGKQLLFVEAKKSGVYFKLPPDLNISKNFGYIKVKTLLTNPAIKEAMLQVRAYCVDSGCRNAAITNGREWVFFRTFMDNQDWRNINAYVVKSLSYFANDFIESRSKFSFVSITDHASLNDLFGDQANAFRTRYFPKERVTSYDHAVTSNHLSKTLRPLIEQYFGRMDASDEAFMDECYVRRGVFQRIAENVGQVIHDSLSPYFQNYNIKEFDEDSSGGEVTAKMIKNFQSTKSREVIVLFGGKGAGKSTFMHKQLFHRPPHAIKFFSKIAIIDLLECPEDRQTIQDSIETQLIEKLDTENLMQSDRDRLLEVFEDRFQVAKRQKLAGLDPAGENYNLQLNQLVGDWKSDSQYVISRLGHYWRGRGKGLVIVLDNTDQFQPDNQDFCFTYANQLATSLNCLVVISMREERFHHSRIHGTLDAFQNSGFHLVSPRPPIVFLRRITYLQSILKGERNENPSVSLIDDDSRSQMQALLHVFFMEFRRRSSHLNTFIQASAHGNMRLALEFFREFVLSGYLQVNEMTEKDGWTLQIHQVIRPMMVPYRLFYDERKSSVPNLYQVRSESTGSHFTGIRLLTMLLRDTASLNPSYVSVSKLRGYFAEVFGMVDDLERNLDVYLQRGIVEANNRLDYYSESVDDVKITAYGVYLMRNLAHSFTYLDLVSLDCAVHDEGVSASLSEYGNSDRTLFLEARKSERIRVRIDKVKEFIEYLKREERLEREIYSLDATDKVIMSDIESRFIEDSERVIRSADRNYGRPS
ncbi:hypothetical protein [Rosistilla oblonga]|uniref:hypothetical protein n=1 Tax=Rosistilla oblonga TaxID=2527990 RepID=UPI003A968BF0